MKKIQLRRKLLNPIVVLMGLFLFSEFSLADQRSKAADTNYVVEYSFLGLKDSAQHMYDRNSWLTSQIAQMNEQIPALQQRLAIFDGQKEKLQLLSEDNFSSKTLKKYAVQSANSFSIIKNQAGLSEEQKILEEKIRQKEMENQNLKENKTRLQDEINKLQYEVSLLNVEMKDTRDKDEWHQFIRDKEQSLKRLRNAQRTLAQLEGKYGKPQGQIKILEQEQKNLQERLGQLENELNISFNQDNDIRQSILNVRGLHAQKMTQLNQEVEKLKLRLKEMEDTLSQAHTKINEKNIQFSAGGYSEDDLKKNLETITQENLALKKEMSSLKENLNKIDSLR